MSKLLIRIVTLLLVSCLLSDPALASSLPFSPIQGHVRQGLSVDCGAIDSLFAREAFASRAAEFPPTLGAGTKIMAARLISRSLELWRAKPRWWLEGAPSPMVLAMGFLAMLLHPAGGLVAMIPGGKPPNPPDAVAASRVTKLIAQLDSYPHFLELVAAAEELGNLGDQRAVWPLINRLRIDYGPGQVSVLVTVAQALGKLRSKEAIKPMGILLQSNNSSIRSAVKKALLQIDPVAYFEIQKTRVLSLLFGKELEALLDALQGKPQLETASIPWDRLSKAYLRSEDLKEIIAQKGEFKGWRETAQHMREQEIRISVKPSTTLDDLLQVSYSIPAAHFRNHHLLYTDFQSRLKGIAQIPSRLKLKFLKETLPPRERAKVRPLWVDSDDDSWRHEHTLYEEMGSIGAALRYILETGFANATDAVFAEIEASKEPREIGLTVERGKAYLQFTVSDSGDGIDLPTLKRLASGKTFESQKATASLEERRLMEEKLAERGIAVAYDLEKADAEFGLKGRQVGGHGRGLHQSAALVYAYGGTLQLVTRDKSAHSWQLTFGADGPSGNMNDDLELPIPIGATTEGRRSMRGTTFIVRLPLASEKSQQDDGKARSRRPPSTVPAAPASRVTDTSKKLMGFVFLLLSLAHWNDAHTLKPHPDTYSHSLTLSAA